VARVTAQRTDGWLPLLAATFAIGVSNSVVFAVLSDLQDAYGFSNLGLGWIAGSGFLVGFVAQLFIAPYADHGHSKRLLLVGLGLAVAGGLLFAVGSSIAVFVLARGILGLSNGTFLPAARAIAASMSDQGVAERLGRLGGIELAGFVTGPVIGGVLVGPLGTRWPFVVCGAAAALAAALLAPRRLPHPPLDVRRDRIALDLVRIREMRVALLLAIGLFLPVGVYDALWDRYLTDRGASNTAIGLSFFMYGIPFALVAAAGGRRADRIGPVRACLLALFVAAPLTGSYGLITVAWLIIVVSMAEGAAQALAVPAAQAAVAAAAPAGRAGAAQGLAGSGSLLGAALASIGAPALYGSLGAGAVFALAGAATLAFGLAAWAIHPQRATLLGRRPPPGPAAVGAVSSDAR